MCSSSLTQREREVLQLAAKGLTNKQIAIRLQIAERTTEFHMTNIFDKLKVATRVEAIVKAYEYDLMTEK